MTLKDVTRSGGRLVFVVASVATLAAACGGSPTVVRDPATTAGAASTSEPVTSTTSGSTSPTTAAVQTIAVTPSTGLVDGQSVRVTATGFSPDEPLVVTECAAKGNATQEGDCNVDAIASTVSDGSGRVSTTFNVAKGPFGANKIVCGACVISVSQASPSPTEEADGPISFN